MQIQLERELWDRINAGAKPRDVINNMVAEGKIANEKQAHRTLEKWPAYEYGVTLDLGWIEPGAEFPRAAEERRLAARTVFERAPIVDPPYERALRIVTEGIAQGLELHEVGKRIHEALAHTLPNMVKVLASSLVFGLDQRPTLRVGVFVSTADEAEYVRTHLADALVGIGPEGAVFVFYPGESLRGHGFDYIVGNEAALRVAAMGDWWADVVRPRLAGPIMKPDHFMGSGLVVLPAISQGKRGIPCR